MKKLFCISIIIMTFCAQAQNHRAEIIGDVLVYNSKYSGFEIWVVSRFSEIDDSLMVKEHIKLVFSEFDSLTNMAYSRNSYAWSPIKRGLCTFELNEDINDKCLINELFTKLIILSGKYNQTNPQYSKRYYEAQAKCALIARNLDLGFVPSYLMYVGMPLNDIEMHYLAALQNDDISKQKIIAHFYNINRSEYSQPAIFNFSDKLSEFDNTFNEELFKLSNGEINVSNEPIVNLNKAKRPITEVKFECLE